MNTWLGAELNCLQAPVHAIILPFVHAFSLLVFCIHILWHFVFVVYDCSIIKCSLKVLSSACTALDV